MSVRRSAIAFVAIALIAASALALDIPPKPAQWVNDYGANVLSAAETQQLNQKLEGFYKRTSVQFLVMVFPSLEGEDDLGYTNRVANMWKVKDEKALMLFVFMKERKTRIQVSYSLEPVITDAFASDIVHSTIPPFFRAGKYADGLNAAVDQMAKKIDPNAVPAGTTPAPPRDVRSSQSSGGIPGKLVIYLILFVIFVLLPMLSKGGRRRGCGGCMWPLFLGGGGGTTFGGGGGGGGSGWSTGGSWGGGGSSFGGGGAGGGW
jgi:Beta-propeller domains of methanol dehydrogenase type